MTARPTTATGQGGFLPSGSANAAPPIKDPMSPGRQRPGGPQEVGDERHQSPSRRGFSQAGASIPRNRPGLPLLHGFAQVGGSIFPLRWQCDAAPEGEAGASARRRVLPSRRGRMCPRRCLPGMSLACGPPRRAGQGGLRCGYLDCTAGFAGEPPASRKGAPNRARPDSPVRHARG
jgi:hypothetical protein